MTTKLLWGVEEAAEQLGLTPSSVYHRVHAGTLPYVKVGSLVKFRPQDLQSWACSLTSTPGRRARSAATSGRRRRTSKR